MDEMIKVVVAFDGLDGSGEPLSFSFLALPAGSRMNVNPKFMSHLFSLAGSNQQFFHSQCITRAVTGQGKSLDELFVNYHCVFFTRKEDGTKRSVMIAYDEDKRPQVHAAWPLSFRDAILTRPESLIEAMHDLNVHPDTYENVNLLSVA